jgi:hypothetical protein
MKKGWKNGRTKEAKEECKEYDQSLILFGLNTARVILRKLALLEVILRYGCNIMSEYYADAFSYSYSV